MFEVPKTMLTFDERGLSLGSRAILAKAAVNGKFDFDAYEERILTLLSITYKSTIPDFVLTGVKGAMNLWNAGHKAAGGIRLAHLRLPAIDNEESVWDSVHKVEGKFDANLIPEGAIFKLLKTFNPAEPRVPAGNGRSSGRWTSGGAAANTSSSQPQPPSGFEYASYNPPQEDASDIDDASDGNNDDNGSDDYFLAENVQTLADANKIVTNPDYACTGNDCACALLVERLIPNLPQAKSWQRGELVQNNYDLPIGTAIATFNYYDDEGTNGYGSSAHQEGVSGMSHSGIYLGQNSQSLIILNQWVGSDHPRISYIPWSRWTHVREGGSYFYTITTGN